MKGLVAVIVIFLAQAVWASEDLWPAMYNVQGVASNDVLNVRNAPTAGAAIVGALAHDATGVEIMGTNDRGTWGRVNASEGGGWVSLRFLARQGGQRRGAVPQIRQCFGTEPFWSITAVPGQSGTWATPEVTTPLELGVGTESLNDPHSSGFVGQMPSGGFVLNLRRTLCSDGMSDRLYGLQADLMRLSADGQSRLYSGCCSLTP